MRTDTYMGTEEVLAVVLEDVAFGLTHSCAQIKLSVEASGSGQYKKMSRDFLTPNAVTTTIARGRTAWKRKCCLIKLSHLPGNLRSQLKKSTPNDFYIIIVVDYPQKKKNAFM